MDWATEQTKEILVWLLGGVTVAFFVVPIGNILAALIQWVGFKGRKFYGD